MKWKSHLLKNFPLREPIQKFGFENLALVEKDPLPDPGPPDPIIITGKMMMMIMMMHNGAKFE